ncbi:carbonic anhydrase [Xylariaceae sp. FL0016]|nr:carbonic anhydrase [Xylariaceae sp. FL0016]
MAALYHLLLLAASVTPVMSFCGSHTHLDRRAEGEVPIGTFGYSATEGPLLWTQLNATANGACSTGTIQSPIDMVEGAFTLAPASDLVLTLPDIPSGTVFENLGTTVEVVTEGLGASLVVDGKTYELAQFHFHHPSEHIDNGVSLPMEMHMVFQTEAAEVAVMSVYVDLVDEPTSLLVHLLGQKTASSTLLETIFSSVGEIATPGTKTTTLPLIMSELQTLLTAGSFQRYTGSLTTPPCTEGVSWLVSTQKLLLSQTTFQAVRDVIGFNARYPQNKLGQPNLLSMVSL